MDSEEYSYFDLQDGQDRSWYEGYSAGKAEVLDTLLPEAEVLIARWYADAPDATLHIVALLDRWINSMGDHGQGV
jgi:hypothetical protein